MSQSPKKSGFNFVSLVIGIAMMVGGSYLSKNAPEGLKAALESLEKQGIPLDPGKTIAAIGVFLILFPVLKSFFFNPLDEAINERTRELESTFAEAESLRSEMTSMKSDYEKRLATTEASAREQIQSQIREAQQLRDTLKAEATSQAEEYKRKAVEEIATEKAKAMTDLRLHVVNLTLKAAEKVVGENMDDARNRKLVEDFIDKVEVPV